nr:MAG TPA: DNA N-6-adenine-methyltransferase [Caudoviricetes sp.]
MKSKTYEEFVEKFKPKKTTDDCYTPPVVYDAIADWVASEYGVNRDNFVRPFYPDGDYENYSYSKDAIVVDNPPFSILSKIVDFYISKNVPFFLFAPNLTLFSTLRNRDCTALVVDASIVYDNGANVKTSFLTNLEPHDLRIRTAPGLYQVVKKATEAVRKETKKQLPKYTYPNYLVQAARIKAYSRYGIEFKVPKSESFFISQLDSQKEGKKTIFGGGFLVSKRCAAAQEQAEREQTERGLAERERAERGLAEHFELSDREKEIIKELSK